MELILVGPDRAPGVADRLASVPTESFEGFEAVAPAAFVDVPG
jgi:hypothetical protein